MTLRALTLRQPWASAVALGLKAIETREWAHAHRGPIAIHAGKGLDDEDRAAWDRLWRFFPGRFALEELPRGAVVAVADLVDVVRMTPTWIESVPEHELPFGGYGEGRFGWVLKNVHAVQPPVPARGFQQLWSLNKADADLVLARMVPL